MQVYNLRVCRKIEGGWGQALPQEEVILGMFASKELAEEWKRKYDSSPVVDMGSPRAFDVGASYIKDITVEGGAG